MISLRTATIEDLDLLLYWDKKQHIIDSDPDDDWNWALELNRQPKWREQLIAELDGQPIGFVQLIDPAKEETNYWGNVEQDKRAIDIWIGEEENLGKGYGTIMMNLIKHRCFCNHTVTGILVDPLKSNTMAHRFYKKNGFEFIEERNFQGMLCFVYEFKKS